MKRTIAITLGLGVVALGSVGIWYWTRTSAINSELAKFEADFKNKRMVKVDVAVAAPPETPADQPLYLAGSAPSLGNWEAAGVPLQKGPDGKHHATVEVMSGIEYGYKVTRGTWSTVERAAGDKDLPNRTLLVTNDSPVDVTVATWVDGGKSIPNRVTTSGEVRLHKKFASKALGNERTIIVYLPPTYGKDDAAAAGAPRFPVLYVQDGQNIFDEATSFAGVEWNMDEAAERLAKANGMEPAVIVGIYNTEQRTPEFTPPGLGDGASARGDAYGKFVVDEVKPFIDKTYRTKPDKENTGIAGSAMGGLITLHVAKNHPDEFSKIGVLTPWLRVGNKTLLDSWNGDVSWLKDKRLWLDMGDRTTKNYPGEKPIEDAQQFVKALADAGIKPGENFQYTEVTGDGGEHNESGWSTRVDQVLAFLFPSKNPPAPVTQRSDVK